MANQQVEEDVHDYPAAGELIEKISLVEGVGHALIKELKKGFAVRDDKIKEQEQELEGLRRREREAGETGNARSISPKKPEWELEPLEQSEDLENLEKSGRSGTEITQPGSGIKDARLEP